METAMAGDNGTEGKQPETKTDPPAGGAGGGSETETVTDWQAEAEKWKAQSRKNENAAKHNATAAEELAKLKDKDKTDGERLTDANKTLTARAETAEGQVLRLQVALDKGLTSKMAARLQGSTREELEADADDLLTAMGGKGGDGKTPPPGKSPRANLTPGNGQGGNEAAEETDPRKLAASLRRR